ncbi:MAG: hypothetical protein AYK23_01880 [Candidatus Proteinoplasmatales archaeon SG8-5]|nr:MAG: hypothetical protein AYK23_01880 [Candidatus Proteinoplasmatales archaeon SG8-5]
MDGKRSRPLIIPLDTREGWFTFVALIMMLYTISLFISVSLHEVLGHGLAAVATGGDFYAVYISPGSGYASLYIPEGISNAARAFVLMAGIMVELIIGSVIFFLVLPRLKGFITHLFGLVLSVTLLVHPSIYLFLGYYYTGGDTFKAARILGLLNNADAFIVAGLILAGVFVILISIAALRFLTGFREEAEGEGTRLLLMFWLPLIVLGVTSAFVSVVMLSSTEMTYALANAGILLLLISAGIILVPHLIEHHEKARPHSFDGKTVLAILAAFLVIIATWVGVFGPTESSAHGIMLHQPPLEAEAYYSDYSIGNVDLMVHSDGTVDVSIILRNMLDNSSSSLDEQLYNSYEDRPNWPYYVERSRYMALVMFGFTVEEAQYLSFETSQEVVRAMGEEYYNGRSCTTHLNFTWADTGLIPGVRQLGGDATTAGGTDEPTELLTFGFEDPWMLQGGYIDEVRISWESNLTLSYYSASNLEETHITFNRGGLAENSIGWKNIGYETSASAYSFIFRRALDT